uniref:C-type lectin domain-containing protein n=1 Tax=Acrobeloides nanus TaxID=290746 RepID=A0A914EK67_9BILA
MSNIQTSNSNVANLGDGISKSLSILDNCTFETNCVLASARPATVLLFAASSNIPNISYVSELIYVIEQTSVTMITVNFNSGDQVLTNFLNTVTYNEFVNASMYEYSSTRNTLTRDLEWALTQGYDINADGPITSRYVYNGLHKNSQGTWVWYNYDLSEFPISYSDWAPNYPDNSTGSNFAAFNIDVNGKLLWKNFPNNAMAKLNMALCQTPACTTESTECCWRCNGMPPEEYYKKKNDRSMRNLNRRKSRLINF